MLGLCAGIWLGDALTFTLREAGFAAGGLAMCALAARGKLRWTAAVLAAVFVGVLVRTHSAFGPTPSIDAGLREVVTLEGCVVEPTVFSPEREQFTLELAPDARAAVSLAVREGDTPQRLDYGQRVEIDARVRPPRNFKNPGAFDYARYLAHRNVFWTASMTTGSQARVLPGRCGWAALAWVYRLRTAAIDRIEELYAGNQYEMGLMEAILVGETSKMEKVWTENFRRTGTYHALVISGVHVTVLAGVLLFLLRLVGVRAIPALAAAAMAWLYAVVSGMSAPVIRAAGGFTLALGARFLYRRTRVLNLLAAVAIALLLYDPEEMFEASFQLSFLAVAVIGAFASPWMERYIRPRQWALKDLGDKEADPHIEPRVAGLRVEARLASETLSLLTGWAVRWCESGVAWLLRLGLGVAQMVALSAMIQFGLLLPMVVYFHRFSFTGLSANVVVAPVMEAVVPIGFAAVFTGWKWLGWIAMAMVHLSAKVADWHAALEPTWRVADPPLWLAVAFGAALLGAVFWRRAWLPAAALGALIIWQPWPEPSEKGGLEMTAIDVGQGDSVLLTLPDGRHVLVDAGGLIQFGGTRRSNLEIGEDVVSPYLWQRGIRRLDAVVATHAHQDHIGGLPAVLANFRPRELWIGTNPSARVLAQARELGVAVRGPRAGEAWGYGGAEVQIVSPSAEYAATKAGNDDSLAFRIAFGERSYLLTGDMEARMEGAALPLLVHSDVLKVGHHGSKTSTTEALLDRVEPLVGLVSVGEGNSFGHPHPTVVGRLEDRGVALLRTDLGGLSSVRTDGRRLWFGYSGAGGMAVK